MMKSMTQRHIRPKRLTEGKKLRWQRWEAIYREWNELVTDPGQSRTCVAKYLAMKYGYSRPGSINDIVRRMRNAQDGDKAC